MRRPGGSLHGDESWFVARFHGLELKKMRVGHPLRHSFASALIMARAAVTEVQPLLGNSGPAVTLYSHWLKNVEIDSADRLTKNLTMGSKNLGHFLDTFEVARNSNTA